MGTNQGAAATRACKIIGRVLQKITHNPEIMEESLVMDQDEEQVERTTYHEAGHCVMAILCGAKVERATIDPEEDGFHGLVDIHWPAGASARDVLLVTLAGPVAEMVYTQEPYHPGLVPEWAHDWKQAWRIARPKSPSDIECLRLLEKKVARLHKLFTLDSWWAAIAAVSDLLATHEEIEHDEIEYEVNHWINT